MVKRKVPIKVGNYISAFKVNLPPGPPRVPILGSIPWLGADVREPLRKMTKK